MLHYRKYSGCAGSGYEAWTVDSCTGDKNYVDLSSPTIQAVVGYAKKNGLALNRPQLITCRPGRPALPPMGGGPIFNSLAYS